MAVIGTTLMNGAQVFSPWFRRGALNALFSAELIALGGSGTLDITVEHRNDDETLPSSAGTFATLSATGVEPLDVTGLKENIRFAYQVGGAGASSWIHFRMLNPTWYD